MLFHLTSPCSLPDCVRAHDNDFNGFDVVVLMVSWEDISRFPANIFVPVGPATPSIDNAAFVDFASSENAVALVSTGKHTHV